VLLSMTGYGEAHRQQGGVTVAIELRTVNNKYLKMAVRSSEGYGGLESRIESVVRENVRRGTVTLSVRVDRATAPEDYRINDTVLASYRDQIRGFLGAAGDETKVPMESLLLLPGVVEEDAGRRLETSEDWPLIESVLREALDQLNKMRAVEGQAMRRELESNCRTIAANLEAIEGLAPRVAEHYRQRLTERLNKLLAEHEIRVEPSDVVREVGLFADRVDISEETVRMRSHLDQFAAILQEAESAGRKLEFITQEMFRETNTIGSKANDAEIAGHVVEIKTVIERIREMVQNIQ
jgi:uncharacterized protein (TIGR00255 family)